MCQNRMSSDAREYYLCDGDRVHWHKNRRLFATNQVLEPLKQSDILMVDTITKQAATQIMYELWYYGIVTYMCLLLLSIDSYKILPWGGTWQVLTSSAIITAGHESQWVEHTTPDDAGEDERWEHVPILSILEVERNTASSKQPTIIVKFHYQGDSI